jgi:DNA-binding CsgD family transcriptional regulator
MLIVMPNGGFVGRAVELATVKSTVTAAAGGLGGTFLVSGEQGIGKSTLLAEGLAGAQELGCRVCWGTADEFQQRFPLQLMAECLGREGRRVLAEERGWQGGPAGLLLLDNPVPAVAERLLTLVHRWCASSPVIVVAEDLQWADEASLRLWQRLARLVEQVPLLLVGSFRPGPGGEEAERLIAPGSTVVALRPLGQTEAEQLAADIVGASVGLRLADLIKRAGGNPLYLRELVAGLVRDGRVAVAAGVANVTEQALPVPVSLAAAIQGRLEKLNAETTAALRWAAVLGAEFSVTDLALVTGRSAEELAGVVEQAVAAGVVARAGARLAFRHGLIRQALYEGMPTSLREALHLQAAQMLAEVGASAERVAAQLAAAPEAGGEWVWQWLTEVAGDLGYRAPQLTAELLRRVLAQLPAADSRREALESALVAVAFLLVEGDELEQVATRLLARSENPDRAAEVVWLLGYSMARNGRRTEAAAAVVEAALGRPGVSEAQIARLRALLAQLMVAMGQPDQAAAMAREALATGERIGDPLSAGYARRALCLVGLLMRDHAAILGHADRALELIGDDPQTMDVRVLLLHDRAEALMELDRHAEADPAIRQLLALADRVGTPARLVLSSHVAAQFSLDTGQWDDAVAVLEPAIGMPSQDGSMTIVRGLLAFVAAHRADWDAAAAHIAAVESEAQTTRDPECLYPLVLAQAMIAERAGRPDEASAVLAQCLGRGIAAGPRREVVLPSLARLAVAAGDHVIAGAAARAAAKEADREPLPFKIAAANHSRGLVAGDPGPVLEAAAYYESVNRLPARAWALEDAAVLLAGLGEQAAARQAFTSATREYARIGAEWDLQRADARLWSHGIRRGRTGRRPATATRGWAALTPTEIKVAELVAEGQSNPNIAAELFLSRNTVQTHVSHILAKLGARSRAEIIRQAFQQASGTPSADRPRFP